MDEAAAGGTAVGDSGARPATARARRMREVNPYVIERNPRVEQALAAAINTGDLAPFERLLATVRQPFVENDAQAPYAEPASAEVTAGYRTFCGT